MAFAAALGLQHTRLLSLEAVLFKGAGRDPLVSKPEVDSFNPPGFINPKQPGIMCRECFHPGNLRPLTAPKRPGRATKMPEDPSFEAGCSPGATCVDGTPGLDTGDSREYP